MNVNPNYDNVQSIGSPCKLCGGIAGIHNPNCQYFTPPVFPYRPTIMPEGYLPAAIEQVKRKASALDRQVGGDHYTKLSIQPWQAIEAWGSDFWTGTAIAYLARWRDKGGLEDVKKAIHTLEYLIEMEERKQ